MFNYQIRPFCRLIKPQYADVKCPGCGEKDETVAKRRRNTCYANDKSNWTISCQGCYDEDVSNFEHLWSSMYYD